MAKSFQNFQAAGAWHLNIQQDQIDVVLPDPFQSFVAVFCNADSIAFPFQATGQQIPVHLIVIHDEERLWLHAGAASESKVSIFRSRRRKSTGLVS